ncbi:MAG: DUF898 domain-containing protein [Acidobacteria bacterium]|nr:DUF898 domain-containing protein [Acidobacteriota bacterium]
MAFCTNCGKEYEVVPVRCECGSLFASVEPSASNPALSPGLFDFTGEGGALLVLYLKLIFLSIVTLGIYSFWGRTEIRRYLWANTRFAGQPFAYHGTGKELFIGWLKLIGIWVGLTMSLALLLIAGGDNLKPFAGLVLFAAFALLAPLAIHGAIRYRWSRTSWQGRHFVYNGDFKELAWIVIPGLFFTAITFTIYLPVFLTNLRRYVTNHTHYGGHSFEFTGASTGLLGAYGKMLLLVVPTLGLYRFWFQSRQFNFYWCNTRFAGFPFRASFDGLLLLMLTFTNVLLTTFTLGIGYPWAICRTIRFVAANLQLEQLPRIQLAASATAGTSAFGDAIGDVIGTDAGIDAGFGL